MDSDMQGGPVDEFLGVAVERSALDQLEVEVGRTLEDRVHSGLTGDHREERHLDAVNQTGGHQRPVQRQAAVRAQPEFLRKANQLIEMMLRADPGDEEIGELREHYDCRPEAMDVVEAHRLEWEASYVEILAEHPASKAELRVRLQARELIHEHQAMFQALLGEYRIRSAWRCPTWPGWAC